MYLRFEQKRQYILFQRGYSDREMIVDKSCVPSLLWMAVL